MTLKVFRDILFWITMRKDKQLKENMDLGKYNSAPEVMSEQLKVLHAFIQKLQS